jgi:hypothetical protein
MLRKRSNGMEFLGAVNLHKWDLNYLGKEAQSKTTK